MTSLDVARDKVVAAACRLASTRFQMDANPPGPYDDAQLELDLEILDGAIGEYAELRIQEIKALEIGG